MKKFWITISVMAILVLVTWAVKAADETNKTNQNIKEQIITNPEEHEAVVKEYHRVIGLPDRILSLVNLKGIRIIVFKDIWENNNFGLSEEQIKTQIELKLRLAGIKILSVGECLNLPDEPTLYLSIGGHKILSVAEVYVSNLSLEIWQRVSLVRGIESFPTYIPKLRACTWSKSMTSGVGPENVRESWKGAIEQLIDEFLNDYLTANPTERPVQPKDKENEGTEGS